MPTPRCASKVVPSDAAGLETARALVRKLLSSTYPPHARFDRRREQRHPFPRLFVLTPVEADGVTVLGPPVTAAGKQLSETGVSFFHPQPLPYRWVVANVQKDDGAWVALLVDLDWCRFTRQGWYESGGRIMKSVHSPLNSGAT